jgi:hypothetical protein
MRTQQVRVDAPVDEEQFAPILVHHRLARWSVTRFKSINISRMAH